MSAVLARRYARAFFDVSVVRKNTAAFQSELDTIATAMQICPDLLAVFTSEEISLSKQERLIDTLAEPLRYSQMTCNFLKVLLHNRRIGEFPEIARAYAKFVAEMNRVVTASVTTAIPLTDQAVLQGVETAIARIFQRNVAVRTQTDPTLIGGVVIRVGDAVYDGSLAAELRRVREHLIGFER